MNFSYIEIDIHIGGMTNTDQRSFYWRCNWWIIITEVNYFPPFFCLVHSCFLYSTQCVYTNLRVKIVFLLVGKNIWGVLGAKFESEEVKGGCRKLQSEELHNLFFSRHNIPVINLRRTGWARHVARVSEKIMLIQDFGGKDWRKLAACKSRFKLWIIPNSKIDFRKIGWERC
jgi:hypothetical protein